MSQSPAGYAAITPIFGAAMLPTYAATLRDGRLDWGTDGPAALPPDAAVLVQVTLLGPSHPPPASGPAMAAALEALAAVGGPSAFGDPVLWQREARAEGPLQGRGE